MVAHTIYLHYNGTND